MKRLSSQSEGSRALALGRFHQLAAHIEEGRSLREVALQAGIAFRTAQRRIGSRTAASAGHGDSPADQIDRCGDRRAGTDSQIGVTRDLQHVPTLTALPWLRGVMGRLAHLKKC